MALSYEFSIGSVSAKEKSLLTQTDIEQMLACKSSEELIRFLSDKGYGEGDSIDLMLADHNQRLWKYLKSIAPEFEIFAPFIIQNDVHNLKVILKGIMASRKTDGLLLTPCSIECSTIREAVEKRKFSLLPEWIAKAADDAYELLAHTGDARFADAVIDSAVLNQMLVLSEKYSHFLKLYFETYVFYCNIKIALRCSRTGITRDFLNRALTEPNGFRKKDIIEATLKGSESLIEQLEKYNSYDCDRAIEEYKKSPASFEKFIENRLILLAKEFCKNKSEGAEPLLGYFLANKYEETAIHIIESGIRTGTQKEVIRERLREIYG